MALLRKSALTLWFPVLAAAMMVGCGDDGAHVGNLEVDVGRVAAGPDVERVVGAREGWAWVNLDGSQERLHLVGEFQSDMDDDGAPSLHALELTFEGASGTARAALVSRQHDEQRWLSDDVVGVVLVAEEPGRCDCFDVAFDLWITQRSSDGSLRQLHLQRGYAAQDAGKRCLPLPAVSTTPPTTLRLQLQPCASPPEPPRPAPSPDAGTPYPQPDPYYRDDDGCGSAGCSQTTYDRDDGQGCDDSDYDTDYGSSDGCEGDTSSDSASDAGCEGDDSSDSGCEGDTVAKGPRRYRLPFQALLFPGLAWLLVWRRSRANGRKVP